MYKISKIVAIALGVIGVILCGGIIFSGVDPWADLLFVVSYVLLAIAILSVVVFGLMNVMSSPEKIKKTLIYTGVFLVIMVVPFFLVSGKDTTEVVVGSLITSFFILLTIAIGLTIYSGIKGALTK